MRLRCRGHLQVFIEHPLHCGVGVGRDRGRQPSRGSPILPGTLASFLSPLEHLLDTTSIVLKVLLSPSRGLLGVIWERGWLHSTPLSLNKRIPHLVTTLPSSRSVTKEPWLLLWQDERGLNPESTFPSSLSSLELELTS